MNSIIDVSKKLDIDSKDLELYGNYIAKVNTECGSRRGKLVLVTAITPTKYGEGKTTISVGLNDSLSELGKKSIACLREPSLGPVFGMKGGACGGGKASIVPEDDINLHFTGDFHAITAANNLLASAIDNHIYQGNELNIDKVVFKRCIDINDRALRDTFNITAASEVMAIFCLATDKTDLRNRLSNILVGYSTTGKQIYARDLKVDGAMFKLLEKAFNPNLVQSLYGNPVLVHGGPFANIAHGCCSINSLKLGLSISDYVITEAGFGADLGAEKFLDIKCPMAGLKPNAIVINATIRSMKYNGGVGKADINKENLEAVKIGIENLHTHIINMQKYTKNILICLNKFGFDTDKEVAFVKKYVEDLGCEFDISESFAKGGRNS